MGLMGFNFLMEGTLILHTSIVAEVIRCQMNICRVAVTLHYEPSPEERRHETSCSYTFFWDIDFSVHEDVGIGSVEVFRGSTHLDKGLMAGSSRGVQFFLGWRGLLYQTERVIDINTIE